MIFNEHGRYKDKHSFLSASSYHWVNYDADKLRKSFDTALMKAKGTRLHAFAAEAIALGVKMPTRPKTTLNMYINDAIGYRMEPEKILFYSDNCFGTADAISFRDKKLRIHDLKTGSTKVKMTQLEVYAAMFCLEYRHHPKEIEIELRIYQLNEVIIHEPHPEDIEVIMAKIIEFDKVIEEMKRGV